MDFGIGELAEWENPLVDQPQIPSRLTEQGTLVGGWKKVGSSGEGRRIIEVKL
jgi:hypothetical protein